MGKKDIRLKTYLADARRYADLWNGSVFEGKQVLKDARLQSCPSVMSKDDGAGVRERTADLVMKEYLSGQKFVLWVAENQEYVDYGMPVRILQQEGMLYGEQVRSIQKENRKSGRAFKDSGEFLYSFKKSNRLSPVVTLILYWGEGEWRGPKSLHDMIDWEAEAMPREIRKLVPEYPLHIINLSKMEHTEYYQTELRPFFELYRKRNDKEAFIDYIKNNEETRQMDEESWRVLGEITHAEKLIQKLTDKKEEEGQDMCRALEEFYNDGKMEGRMEGKIESILSLLGELGEVSGELKSRICEKKEPEILEEWLKKAARAESIREFEMLVQSEKV